MEIYTTVLDAEKPVCCRYDFGKERTTSTGILYFYIDCRLLDFNKLVFNKVLIIKIYNNNPFIYAS